ncbi:AzlC family ABC transporter permease [Ligilactobacillus sp. WILCCON 0076]|uniref:AzlC family ABC transporter permease n=1 Tax=Ligilactobacillus ubinensis TaxID=2876789 RepID=A0A9X2FM78_9LACO|nr:AzlC family ABC transporter permease [Ligilactobacillus ubinensis]MCP0887226.1 AzlC family ABC transporter permease [Ligilactobacillus ubinensis]
MKKEEPRWVEVLRVALPLCLSYVPIGLACGILLNKAGFNAILTLLVSLLVFSGGAQFLIASMLVTNAPIHTIVLMLFFLELRYALLGSSLSQYLRGTSRKFLYIFAMHMNDENYAVNYLKFATDKEWKPSDALMVEHYSLLFWSVANLIGSFIGSLIEINLSIVDFALTAMFLYMIIMQVKNKLTILVSLLSAIVAIVAMCLLKSTMGLIIATLIASLVGFAVEDYLVKHGHERGFLLGKIKHHSKGRRVSVPKSDSEGE